MKKIAIVTLNGYFNYGNRLQNYALQEKLSSLGFSVQTIRLNRYIKKNKYKQCLGRVRKWIIGPATNYTVKQREEIFINFSRNYIAETEKVYYMDDNLTELNNKFDFFIVGSDQVWNPSMNRVSPLFFLNFAEESKRIAYAPSFGISELSRDISSEYQKWLSEIPYLSVREGEGAKIIKELTGRYAPVLVDPTLLLTKEKWLSIAKKANSKPKDKYLLTYFLGGIPDNYKNQIQNIVKEHNLEVINLGDIKEKGTYRTGPSEFIDYISDCSIFCTDSFHGAAFSILLEKPFIVYERVGTTSMYSRINTLLGKFNLNSRKAENMIWEENIFNIDFSHVPLIIQAEREKAIEYLIDALDITHEC